jgi:hypothetical protein
VKFSRVPATIVIVLIICTLVPATALVFFTSSTPQIITKGDSFSIRGTGAVNGTIALWIIGRDYFDVLTDTPDEKGNFSITLKPSQTEKLSTGQYAVIFQDPGPGGMMEIEAGTDSFGNITIMNRGKIIAKLGSRKDLKGNVQPEVAIIMNAADIKGVDDTFLSDYFFVEEPSVWFDQLTTSSMPRLHDQIAGNRIIFSGTTNLGTEHLLIADIYDLNTNTLVLSKPIPVVAGRDMNHWSYEISDPGLPQGNYTLEVQWTTSNATGSGSAIFTVKNPVYPTALSTSSVYEGREQRFDLSIIIVTGMLLVFALIVYAIGKK